MNTRRRSCFSPQSPEVNYTYLEPVKLTPTESVSPPFSAQNLRSVKHENEYFQKSTQYDINSPVSTSPTDYPSVSKHSGQRSLRQRTASGTPSEPSHTAETKQSTSSTRPRGLLNRVSLKLFSCLCSNASSVNRMNLPRNYRLTNSRHTARGLKSFRITR
ncbi:unnamed protein product [Trichobilharzia regenti]|nr:unnamed protein product [Trichobilharzia regenti]